MKHLTWGFAFALLFLIGCGSGVPFDDSADEGAYLAREAATLAAESKYDMPSAAEASFDATVAARGGTVFPDDVAPQSLADDIPADTEICISWTEARAHVGEETCVRGVVTSTYDSGHGFFIDFTSERTAFYLVSFDYTWDNMEGNCIVAYGLIEMYENRPEIIVRDPSQLSSCANSQVVYPTATSLPARPAATAAPNPVPIKDPVWVSEYHEMREQTIQICASVADVRAGPGVEYPIVDQLRIADRITAFGWVRNWFYLGADDQKQHYFVSNESVCALNQDQLQSTAPRTVPSAAARPPTLDPNCKYPTDNSTEAYGKWLLCIEPHWTAIAPFEPTFVSDFGPCDSYVNKQWAMGKSSRYMPECTPTPRPH